MAGGAGTWRLLPPAHAKVTAAAAAPVRHPSPSCPGHRGPSRTHLSVRPPRRPRVLSASGTALCWAGLGGRSVTGRGGCAQATPTHTPSSSLLTFPPHGPQLAQGRTAGPAGRGHPARRPGRASPTGPAPGSAVQTPGWGARQAGAERPGLRGRGERTDGCPASARPAPAPPPGPLPTEQRLRGPRLPRARPAPAGTLQRPHPRRRARCRLPALPPP